MVITVSLKDLKKNLFVRKQLNQEQAIHYGELLANGVNFPPIKITKDLEVVDGRHRIEAHELENRTTIQAEIIQVHDKTEMIAAAFKANAGGSLPPTSQDIEHTITLLLEAGCPKKYISDKLGLPPKMTRRLIEETQSKLNRARLLRAASAVTDEGMTVQRAAETHGVEPERLKEILNGHKRKGKQGVQSAKMRLTRLAKSNASTVAAILKKVVEQYEDGDLSELQVQQTFDHIQQQHERALKNLSDWRARFDAKVAAPAA